MSESLNSSYYYHRSERVKADSDEEMLIAPGSVEIEEDKEVMMPGKILLPPEASYEINCIIKEKIENEGYNIFPFSDAKTIWLERAGLSFTDGTDGKITVGSLLYKKEAAGHQFVFLGTDSYGMRFIRPGGDEYRCSSVCLDYWEMVKV